MRIKKKTHQPPFPLPPAPVREESVKTTVTLRNHIYRQAKERARVMGVSFNGYLSQLVYRDLTPTYPDSTNPTRTWAGRTPYSSAYLPRPWHVRSLEEKHGYGITLSSGDSGSDQEYRLTWQDILDYDEAVGKHSELNGDPYKLAKKLGKPADWALACDVAFQTPEYQDFLKDYNKTKKERHAPVR